MRDDLAFIEVERNKCGICFEKMQKIRVDLAFIVSESIIHANSFENMQKIRFDLVKKRSYEQKNLATEHGKLRSLRLKLRKFYELYNFI